LWHIHCPQGLAKHERGTCFSTVFWITLSKTIPHSLSLSVAVNLSPHWSRPFRLSCLETCSSLSLSSCPCFPIANLGNNQQRPTLPDTKLRVYMLLLFFKLAIAHRSPLPRPARLSLSGGDSSCRSQACLTIYQKAIGSPKLECCSKST
jgi:hypothetical protein